MDSVGTTLQEKWERASSFSRLAELVEQGEVDAVTGLLLQIPLNNEVLLLAYAARAEFVKMLGMRTGLVRCNFMAPNRLAHLRRLGRIIARERPELPLSRKGGSIYGVTRAEL